ncbi:MAG: T9SS C-terminal target domain-containing protein, partial [Bacteroidetes bacterium]|nr:T9SS C-terminal target domain-containing protein [Bacteroidota bacterium]
MKHKKQILITCILLLGVVFAHGQTTANTSGGEASGSGGAVSYSVGQVVCQTYSGTNGSVAEGVQQPYEF